jgi:Ca-activated chloride channel family protein
MDYIKKLKEKLTNKRFIAFVAIVGALLAYQLFKLLDRNVGKVDDWRFSQNMTTSQSLMESIRYAVENPTAGETLALSIAAVILLTNLVLAIRFTIRLFKKYIWADNPKEIVISKTKFLNFLSILSLGTVVPLILVWRGTVPEYALIATAVSMILAALATTVYFIVTIIRAIIRKLNKKPNKDFFTRIGLSLVGTVQSGSVLTLLIIFANFIFGRLEMASVGSPGGGQVMYSTGTASPVMPSPSLDFNKNSETIGYSTGGAKDINNFRENIKNSYLPIVSDITYEGLFYDYYFDTGRKEQCSKLFCPSYSLAKTEDPISRKQEYYLSVGLNSGITKEDFQRKNLNLVVVLDISGSMSSSFNTYYYDNPNSNPEQTKTKMQIANESVADLLNYLRPEDRFGMVLFDSQAYKAKPLHQVNMTDIKSIQNHILEIQPAGGTNMSAGLNMASDMLSQYKDADSNEYENRIIFLTDAMPNTGITGRESLVSITERNAEDKIYSTFIGIGLDFNTDLVESLTKVRGANYYSVHNNDDFKYRMAEGFEYMVTPLVFDLKLELQSENYEIEKVYGSPEANQATGEIMKVNTLFPSDSKEGQNKGGLVLIKLSKKNNDASEESEKIELKVSYEDRRGEADSSSKTIEGFQSIDDSEYFENSGIRKGILLSRYASLLKSWVIDTQRSSANPANQPIVDNENGIPADPEYILGQWERQSTEFSVSPHYKDLFDLFRTYFENEMEEIEDETLRKELELLKKLSE